MKIKKVLVALLAVLAVGVGTMGLTACDSGRKDNHSDTEISNSSGEDSSGDVGEENEGILTYTLSEDGTYYSVTGIGSYMDTELIIPDTYEGLPVTHIGKFAFSCCNSLTSVVIPNSVETIDYGAFEKCENLTSVVIGSGVRSMDTSAFCFCYNLTKVVILDGATCIGALTFYDCRSLTEVVIPDSVTSIGGSAFKGCSSLEEIILSDSLMDIGGDVFVDTAYYNNENNWEESGVLYVGKYLIAAKDVTGAYTVKEETLCIAAYAFNHCDNLTSIIIGNSVKSIGDHAFAGCDGLINAVIGDGVTIVGVEAFCACKKLSEVVFGNSVTNIREKAFYVCDALTEVVLGENVTCIEKKAFYGCDNLSNVVIPESVKKIGLEAFAYCKNLTTATFAITEGWNATGWPMPSENLADLATAAEWLRVTYTYYVWTRE